MRLTEWITRSLVNKAKGGGYVRIILLYTIFKKHRKEQIKNNL